mmetsp:Transcript_44677/g.105870  ORF Transcript_44677/g.105870 Transcript_44677/m.105870 type:complete len:284 (-) Transcript_44677:712-1563(-)
MVAVAPRPVQPEPSDPLEPQRAHARLLLLQIHLLRPDDRARPAHAQPRHRFRRRKVHVLHHVHGNQRARAPQPGEAMHRDRALRRLRDAEELVDDRVRGRRAVGEEEVVVVKTLLHERRTVVLLVVEPDHSPDPLAPEHVAVVGRQQRVPPVPDRLPLPRRALERKELVLHHLVHVSVRRMVVIKVLVLVEINRVVQPRLQPLDHSGPAVGHVQVECTRDPCGIAVRDARAGLDLGERSPCLLRRSAQVEAEEGPEEVDRIGDVALRCASVQNELCVCKAWVD